MKIIKTKILRFKGDYNTPETVAKPLTHIYGNVYYNTATRHKETLYNYYVVTDDKKYAYPLRIKTEWTPKELIGHFERESFSQNTFLDFFKKWVTEGIYINSLNRLFAEVCGATEILKVTI